MGQLQTDIHQAQQERGAQEQRCYDDLRRVRWPAGVSCPRCGGRRVSLHATSVRSPRRRYWCNACARTFTDLTDTLLARTNLPLSTWWLYLRLAKQGLGTAEAARRLGVKWDTVAHMQRRVDRALARQAGVIRQLMERL